MAEAIDIRQDVPLHTLGLTWDSAALLTASALTYPIDDFAALYRMATGVYGRAGYRRMNQPFRYARPYVATAHLGSPLLLEVIVPTVMVGGAAAAKYGLPRLVDLVKQVLLLPSLVVAEREKNLRDRDQARLDRLRIQEQLDHPDDARRKAFAEQRADIRERKRARSSRSQRRRRFSTTWTRMLSPGFTTGMANVEPTD